MDVSNQKSTPRSNRPRAGDRAAGYVRDARARLGDAALLLGEASLSVQDSEMARKLARLARCLTQAALPFGEITRSLRGRP